MTNLSQITFAHPNGTSTVPMFRADVFTAAELIEDYFLTHISPVLENCNDASIIRCSISGFPVANVLAGELDEAVTSAVYSLRLESFNDPLNAPTQSQLVQSIERVIEHVCQRTLLQSRRGIALSYTNDSFAIAHMSYARQMAILLNSLLFDAGMIRDSYKSVDDQLVRIRRSAALADMLLDSDETDAFMNLYGALVELDAKYRITKLRFYSTEQKKLDVIRSHKKLSFKELEDFVVLLIANRDMDGQGVETYPQSWTQEAFRRSVFSANTRLVYSNVVEAVEVATFKTKVHESAVRSERRAAAKTTPKKEKVYKSAEGAERAAVNNIFAAMDLTGGFKF